MRIRDMENNITAMLDEPVECLVIRQGELPEEETLTEDFFDSHRPEFIGYSHVEAEIHIIDGFLMVISNAWALTPNGSICFTDFNGAAIICECERDSKTGVYQMRDLTLSLDELTLDYDFYCTGADE